MKKTVLAFAALGICAASGGVDWEAVNAAARRQARTPIRAGVPGVRPFWNGRARAFIHPPAFEFKTVAGAVSYRFTLADAKGRSRTWTAAAPWSPLDADAWDATPPGPCSVKVEGVDSAGRVAGLAGERRFHRAAVFRGPYPAAASDYRAAAARVYAAVYAMPHVRKWETAENPPEGYDLYCYPAKILSAMTRALVRHARNASADRESALALARRMSDWLIAHSQPADAPLAFFPPTYWGDRRDVAVRNAGQNMLGYPAHAALAYFDLADATGDEKYRTAAIAIARTYVKRQESDGTWPLKVRERDGSPVRANRLVPARYVLETFDRALAATGDAAFARARDRAFAFVLDGPATTWNWDGQFEDMDPMPPYANLQKGVAVDAAGRLFGRGETARAQEIVDWCEDQFTVWSDPVRHMDWRNWKTPTALEQYDYYTPIDASMGDMIGAFAAAYRATGDRVCLEKAKALADNITRHQRADGTIPTYFDSRRGSDWVNCMVYVADRLEFLASAMPDAAE